jgi:hypothetical protein
LFRLFDIDDLILVIHGCSSILCYYGTLSEAMIISPTY